ncbi:MAG: L-serine ammonia-lyase [Hyphomicrobiaceae bacterium]|nr:L-serine ammonia-lyase [Hyphomicrobiaceae bacterium]
MISTFDLFRIGIGPSSSHTVGPMRAARRFAAGLPAAVARVEVTLFGSLAWTAAGHGTHSAVCLGLLGAEPATLDPDDVPRLLAVLARDRRLPCGVPFDPTADVTLDFDALLPLHTNGMRFRASSPGGTLLQQREFYSIGGGFVIEAGEDVAGPAAPVPYPFASAMDLLSLCHRHTLSIADVQRANECALRPPEEIAAGLDAIIAAMFACIERGMHQSGVLPGGLRLHRRAGRIADKLKASRPNGAAAPHEIMDWVSVFALAVNEENAAGGRVVTAPTNGAAGIIPAVLRYARDFCPATDPGKLRDFLMTAAAIGSLIKRNASISGADVGCQGEVGSAAAMAAAGLAATLGATPAQVENAAEIAMEHHLGMTCDPVAGLVQIPCIERNALGAHKAIAAASLALRGDGSHHVSLDQVIETMRQTGADMQTKYKETSQGGLAANVPAC